MKLDPHSWYQRLVQRHIERRTRLYQDQPPATLDGFAERNLQRSGFAYGLPHLPNNLVLRLDAQRGGARIILFALTRWSLEILDEARAAGGQTLSDDELKTLHIRLMADLCACPERLEVIGDCLERLGLGDGVPLTGLPMIAGQTSIEARFIARWAESYARKELTPERRAELRRKAAQERLQFGGLLLAMHAAEGAAGLSSAKVIRKQILNLQVERNAQTRLESWLLKAPKPAEVVAVTGAMENSQLLLCGLVAAALDGHQSQAEMNMLVAFAEAAGISPARLDELGAGVAQMIFTQYDLVERLWTEQKRHNLDRSALYAALLNHGEKVVNELKEASGAMNLMRRASLGQGLSKDEWSNLRGSLSDMGRTVPALALFAMPGGALLLPAAARALPFDLRPSSYRESHLAPSWFGELAEVETLFHDEYTQEFPDPLLEPS
jgi:hypothetical protein